MIESLDSDTIVAQATAPGRGGIAIVRISGKQAVSAGNALCQRQLTPRHVDYGNFYDRSGQVLDQGIALFFKAPHSFTGEDVVELQCHGGPVIVDLLIREILSLDEKNIRIARPGEFSERAFINGKIDLIQAEAIADLIDSGSEQAARNAVKSLQGAFSERIAELQENMIQLRMYVESAIDFPDEEIDLLEDRQLSDRITSILAALKETQRLANQGSLFREGMNVVMAGAPNAGKSSLLNALAQRESAIVTDIPGTTRDVLKEHIHIDGLPLHIIDTAGLRESSNQVEQEGIRRAWQQIKSADRILLMVDAQDIQQPDTLHPDRIWPEFTQTLGNLEKVTIIANKIDLLAGSTATEPELINPITDDQPCPIIRISAKQGTGIELVRKHLKSCMGLTSTTEGTFTARRRHLDALKNALILVEEGAQQLSNQGAGELLAEDLRQAQQCLSEITGEFSTDDLLGRIFSEFCIGK